MFSDRGCVPLSYYQIPRADIGVVSGLELEPEQVEEYLGPIDEIQAAVRRGLAHAATAIEAGDTLVGFYVVHPDRRDNACWWLGWFALDRRHQGRGYGRTALARIMAHFGRIAGCRRVRLLVVPANNRAIRLYEQAGFSRVGVNAAGEYILEAIVRSVATVQNVVALLRASSASKRARRAGRLRLSPGPHAALTIGFERGPPATA
jgi:GNAT superfamily N-acetyltransferase